MFIITGFSAQMVTPCNYLMTTAIKVVIGSIPRVNMIFLLS